MTRSRRFSSSSRVPRQLITSLILNPDDGFVSISLVQDAIDLVRFVADVAIYRRRFRAIVRLLRQKSCGVDVGSPPGFRAADKGQRKGGDK